MVRSTMKPLTGGWRTPDLIISPLDSFPAAMMSRSIPIMNRMGEVMQPVMIAFCRTCHSVVKSLA